ncbi:DUF2125 domain-containing protein [uncultured Tateyamaria sp.]|uniref:DUF2125 domain-containing protein n=1 Tax=uncultured Tateyamaria sp. TaxID=455651 RepID=UPI0026250C5E|nr:DUF2125 domain-containing protein [uncultured Tateyamaria sp.]
MPRISLLIRSSAIALCLPASAAFADLTSADVWSDWKSYMTSAGYDLTASEATNGGTLTVTNLNMAMELGEDVGEGTARIVMPDITFVEQGDGSVSIELPTQTSIVVNMTPPNGEKVDLTIRFDQTDPVMSAAGDPGDLTYTYASASAVMAMDGLTVNGLPIPQDIAKFDLKMSNMAYVVQTTVGTLRTIQQDITVDAMDYDIAFTDPEGEGSFKLLGAMTGIAMDASGDLPLDSDPQDMNAMLNAGLDFDGTFTSTGGNYELTFNGPDGSGTANSTSEGGEFGFAMSMAGLSYDVLQRNVDFNMLITEFPLPLSISAAEIGTSFLMPVQKSAEDQPFGLGVSLSDFTMSDMIWGLFDPTGQLPRDPATLIVDLSGQAKVLFNFLDPSQAAILETTGAAPGELNALTLNKLELNAVGAQLTGAGEFTFDNSDVVTFDGMPRPEGGIDLKLVGGNGLLDKLVGMGLVPQDQAMGARMMMGLFAVPGEAPDTLNSRIEVNNEGHVLANGQRIR